MLLSLSNDDRDFEDEASGQPEKNYDRENVRMKNYDDWSKVYAWLESLLMCLGC